MNQKHGENSEIISQPPVELKWRVARAQMTRLIRIDENAASDKTHLVFQHIPVRTFPGYHAKAPSCCLEEDFFCGGADAGPQWGYRKLKRKKINPLLYTTAPQKPRHSGAQRSKGHSGDGLE
ncbi:uncharacterized [Tachysurus ichikawai]